MDIIDLINGILGSLVSVTAGCFLYHAWEAIVIGVIGSFLTCITMPMFDRLGVDDPVGASSVHGICGIWGVLAVGLFADNPIPLQTTNGRSGLFKGGGWYLLGIQSLSALCLTCWGIGSTFLLLWVINKIVPIRMDPNEELLGADLMEHRIRHNQIGISRAISALAPLKIDLDDIIDCPPIGLNPGHEKMLTKIRLANSKMNQWGLYEERMTPKRNIRRPSTRRGSLNIKSGNFFNRRKNSNNIGAFGTNGFFKPKDIEVVTISNDENKNGQPQFAWID